MDVVNFHMKPGTNYPSTLESVMDSWTSAVKGILQPAELAKPSFVTESGYSASGWGGPYTVDLNQAAYIARIYLYDYYKGYASNTWYDFTTNNNQNGLGSIAANSAYSQIYSQMVGAQGLTCSTHQNGSGDAAQPSLYICAFTEPDGTAAQWMWDADNTGASFLEHRSAQQPGMQFRTMPRFDPNSARLNAELYRYHRRKNDDNWRPGAGRNTTNFGPGQALIADLTDIGMPFEYRFGTAPIGMS